MLVTSSSRSWAGLKDDVASMSLLEHKRHPLENIKYDSSMTKNSDIQIHMTSYLGL